MAEKIVEVSTPWRNKGVGQRLLVDDQATAPYYDEPFYPSSDGQSSIPVSHVVDID